MKPADTPLSEGQKVIVRHERLGALPATIETREGFSTFLALGVREERIQLLVGQPVAIERTSGRGIDRFPGTLVAERRGVLTVALDGSSERIQRRSFVRVEANLELTLRGVDDGRLGGKTNTLDVSADGVRIIDPWRLPVGADVRVTLTLPAPPPLELLGRVVRAVAADQKGIRFDGIDRADQDRLLRYIREREVMALRAART